MISRDVDEKDKAFEEMREQMYDSCDALTDDHKIAEAIVALFDRAYHQGWKHGHERGIDWGRATVSRWWWFPALMAVMFIGTAFGGLLTYALMADDFIK